MIKMKSSNRGKILAGLLTLGVLSSFERAYDPVSEEEILAERQVIKTEEDVNRVLKSIKPGSVSVVFYTCDGCGKCEFLNDEVYNSFFDRNKYKDKLFFIDYYVNEETKDYCGFLLNGNIEIKGVPQIIISYNKNVKFRHRGYKLVMAKGLAANLQSTLDSLLD